MYGAVYFLLAHNFKYQMLHVCLLLVIDLESHSHIMFYMNHYREVHVKLLL